MSSDKDLPLTEEEKQESLLWEALEEGEFDYQQPKRGEIRDGVILRKDEDQIIVDIGAKREGIVPATDLEKLGPEAVAELQVGDPVPVYVLRPDSQDGDIIVSINMARQMADWDEAERLMEAEEILEKQVTGYNKGGLLVQVGQLQGFIPRSHIVDLNGRTRPGTPQERLNQMIGRDLPLKIIEVNRRQRRLILSERAAWREWRAEQKKRLLADLEVGDVRTGTVTSLADFGAFVDLGGADGLIHLSELSWERGRKPSDLLRVGDEVQVKIISLDRERKRIGLSLKQLKPDPWQTIEERYAIGQYIDVEVTNLAKFGAFARLEEGVEGLIHISELADHPIQHPNEVVEPGQMLTVQILSVDPQRKRVGLSLRRVPDHLRMPVEVEEEEIEEPEEPQVAPEIEAEVAEAVAEPTEVSTAEAPEPVEAQAAELAEGMAEQAEETTAQEPQPAEESEPVQIGDGSADEPADPATAEASPQPSFDSAPDKTAAEPASEGQEHALMAAGANGDNVAEEEAQAVPAAEAFPEPGPEPNRTAAEESS